MMKKEKHIKILQGILKTDIDLNFLSQLKETELEILVVCIRDRIEKERDRFRIYHTVVLCLLKCLDESYSMYNYVKTSTI